MIAIVDYGLGNIQAFANIYKRLGISASSVKNSEDLKKAKNIILPGVGSFDWAMTKLNGSGMRESLDEMVLHQGVPVLGVCVGMQMMAQRSDEGNMPGLGWFEAEVKKFDLSKSSHVLPLPHMGWNNVHPKSESVLFRGIEDAPFFYFLHSYYFSQRNDQDVLATSDYGGNFTSAVQHEHIFGVQFHPEKSHQWGIELLKNFAEI